MWSKGTLGDTLPPGLGINLSNSYLLMMVVYEELTEQLTSEKSGLILEYEQDSNNIKTAHRDQSFTSLVADIHQDINRVSSFIKCLKGTFP